MHVFVGPIVAIVASEPGRDGQRVDAAVPRVVGREDGAALRLGTAAPPAVEAAVAAASVASRGSFTGLVSAG